MTNNACFLQETNKRNFIPPKNETLIESFNTMFEGCQLLFHDK